MTAYRSIAAAQTIPRRGDVAANVEEHLWLVRVAAAQHAQLLVFPELSLTGYELDLALDLSFSETDARLDPLIESVYSHGMTLIVGAPVRVGSRLHIGAFIISPDRSPELYTKHYLGVFPTDASADGVVPPAEATVFHPGDRSPLVRFRGHVAAVAVCADTGRPSHPEQAAECGAKTYLASMFVIPDDLEQEAARLRRYSVQHSMAVVMANYGGPSGGLDSGGASAIWSGTGERLAQLERRGSGIAVAIECETGWGGKAVMLAGFGAAGG